LAKNHGNNLTKKVLNEFSSLLFLALETDGSVFTQVMEARLESFTLQVERINQFKKEIDRL
jgi:hypothetical protein